MPYRVRHIPKRSEPRILTSSPVDTYEEADTMYMSVSHDDVHLSAVSLVGDGSSLSWIEYLDSDGIWKDVLD